MAKKKIKPAYEHVTIGTKKTPNVLKKNKHLEKEIIFQLGFYCENPNAFNEKRKYGYKLLVKEDGKYNIINLPLKNVGSFSPGVILYEKKWQKNQTIQVSKTYDKLEKIYFDTKDVTYGTYKNLNLMDVMARKLPEKYLDMILDEYCAIVHNPKICVIPDPLPSLEEQKKALKENRVLFTKEATNTTYIFPSYVIGSATYFHHMYLAEAAVQGNIQIFDNLKDQYIKRRNYTLKDNLYTDTELQSPDIFYKKDPNAKREFELIFKRIRSHYAKSDDPNIKLLIRFPFGSNREQSYDIHGIYLDTKHFLVHEIVVYETFKGKNQWVGNKYLNIDQKQNIRLKRGKEN